MIHMNCRDIEKLWDDQRDGELAGEQSAAFEAHLRACEECAAKWQRESAWLSALNDEPAASAGFTAAVVSRWQAETRPRRMIVARIGPLIGLAASLAVAA